MGDRHISPQSKGNVLGSYVTPAYTALETMAPTEKDQDKVQVCEKQPGKIVGVKEADKRRMDELRVEIAVKDSFQKKLARIMLKRATRVERMVHEKLTKRADAQKVEGKRNEEGGNCDGDCIKRILEKVG